MKIHFRPIPLLTLFCLPALAALLALGAWQIERLHWKLGLIAEMNHNMSAPPVSVDAALAMGNAAAQYHTVKLRGRFDNAKEAYVFTTVNDGDAAYHVVVPFVLDDGRVFLVDRGYVTPALKNPAARAAGIVSGETDLVGVWRTPDRPGVFTPRPDPQHRIWYSRDIAGIAAADGVRLAAPVLIEAGPEPNAGGWPKGGQTIVNLPNDHLQYAITWFALAAGLMFVYLAYHQANGRLGIRP